MLVIVRRNRTGGGVVVGFPGWTGDRSYFAQQRALYASSSEPRVPVEAHAAFGAELAAVLDTIGLTMPLQPAGGDTSAAPAFAFPTSSVPRLAGFTQAVTTAPVIGRAYNSTVMRQAADVWRNASDAAAKERAGYTLACGRVLRSMADDAVRLDASRAAGELLTVLAVAGVIVAVTGLEAWFAHLDHVAEVEAATTERAARAQIAAASADYSARLAAHAQNPSQPMAPPSANETAARDVVARAAQEQSDWASLVREAGTAAKWGTAAVVALLAFKMFRD